MSADNVQNERPFDAESGHYLDDECWCHPVIKLVAGGVVVIHNDAIGVRLTLSPEILTEVAL